MRPTLPIVNQGNQRRTNTELFSYCFLGKFTTKGTNLKDFIFRKFRHSVKTAFVIGESCSTFLYRIYSVIFISSKEKMSRIHTQWIVAIMEYANTLWYSSICQFPGYSMGILNRSVAYRPIFISPGSKPNPAGIWTVRLINLRPESFHGEIIPLVTQVT